MNEKTLKNLVKNLSGEYKEMGNFNFERYWKVKKEELGVEEFVDGLIDMEAERELAKVEAALAQTDDEESDEPAGFEGEGEEEEEEMTDE